jgi:hypothetical protein
MTSRSLTRTLALASTLAVFGWSFVGGCSGHPLTSPHQSGGGGKGAAGSSTTATAGTSPTGTGQGSAGDAGQGTAGSSTTGTAGTSSTKTGQGTAGDTAPGAAGAAGSSVGVAGSIGSGSGGAIGGSAGGGGSNVTPLCALAQSDYDGLRDELAPVFESFGCNVDSDCVAVAEPGNCGPVCPDIALPTSAESGFLSNLMSDAEVCDGACPKRPLAFCPANAAMCRGGKCILAGNVGAGGTTGTIGTGSGGANGGAGQGGAGGACGPCPMLQCNPGYTTVVDRSISCCAICRPINCAALNCAPATCPVGSHTEVPAGECCPVCVMDSACDQALAQYGTDSQAFLQKYNSFPCKLDTDCQLVFPQGNACDFNCGEALPVVTASDFEMNIANDVMACSATCTLEKAPPPCPPHVAVCSNGTCAAALLPLGIQ